MFSDILLGIFEFRRWKRFSWCSSVIRTTNSRKHDSAGGQQTLFLESIKFYTVASPYLFFCEIRNNERLEVFNCSDWWRDLGSFAIRSITASIFFFEGNGFPQNIFFRIYGLLSSSAWLLAVDLRKALLMFRFFTLIFNHCVQFIRYTTPLINIIVFPAWKVVEILKIAFSLL